MFVIERLEVAFDDAVGLRTAVLGSDVRQLGAAHDEAGESIGLVGGSVVRHDGEGFYLTRPRVDEILLERRPEELFCRRDRSFQHVPRPSLGPSSS